MTFGESSYSYNEGTVTYNAANLFNCLCSTIKSAKSVTTFKNLYWCDMEQYVQTILTHIFSEFYSLSINWLVFMNLLSINN